MSILGMATAFPHQRIKMTYEFAKQLKDAGFPQGIEKSSGVDNLLGGVPYSPTLSQLIEACVGFNALYRVEYEWWAQGQFQKPGSKTIEIRGSTPQEAVAKLWLALHQS